MELHLPRREIVRTVRSLLGVQTDNGLAAAVQEQHVAAVQAASLKVATDCRWVTAQARVTVTTGVQQGAFDYPEGCGAGSIMAMAVFDQNRYFPLEARILPVQSDIDQQLLAGGDALTGLLGRPTYFQQRLQINTWPLTDKSYPLRIEYMRPMNLPADTSVSIVDAQLIVYAAAATVAGQMSDGERATYFGRLYADRLGGLRAWQASNSRFALDREADLGEDEFSSLNEQMPNWNRLPTQFPPVP